MKKILNSITGGALLSLFTMNAQSQDLKPESLLDNATTNAELPEFGNAQKRLSDIPSPLKAQTRVIEIANFALMYNAINQEKRSLQFDGTERILNAKSGSVRVDYRTLSNSRGNTASLFKSDFNTADFKKHAQKIENTAPPEEYNGAIYFKKGMVHEISANTPHGGGTLSAPLNASFNAEEDGKSFIQADLTKMVHMAIETDGFEIALDFNADQDGNTIVTPPPILMPTVAESETSSTKN